MAMPLPLPTYTTDMLRGFPPDGLTRYELLEGMLLVTPGPGSAHQIVLGDSRSRWVYTWRRRALPTS